MKNQACLIKFPRRPSGAPKKAEGDVAGLEILSLEPVDISESLLGKGTAGRTFKIFFETEGLFSVNESHGSLYVPGFVL